MKFIQRRYFKFALIPLLCLSTASFGQGQTTVRPPQLELKPMKDEFKCQRNYVYQGNLIRCDSMLHNDGEGMRTVLSQVPEAMSELNTYQANRQRLRSIAYIGAIGLLVAVAGAILSTQFRDANRQNTNTSIAVRNLSILGGLGITVGGFAYGASAITNNESHLAEAIQKFNAARPDDQIQLQFRTQFDL